MPIEDEWEEICKWIKSKDIPDDSEISLVVPFDPITRKPDGRIWIDVLSDSWGWEHSEISNDPFEQPSFDPTFRQYQFIETDVYYRAREILKEILECPFQVDQATVPKAGIETAPDQVVVNFSMSLRKRQKALEIFKRLGGVT